MLPTLVYACPRGSRILDVAAAEGEVYFAIHRDETTTLWRAPYGYPARPIAKVNRTRLVAIEQDGLLWLEADDTLVLLDRNGSTRTVLRTLKPSPIEIVATPEHVIWCSDAEVWRWWRHDDTVERLGTHDATAPLLAHRPVPLPYPPHRFAPDVAIAAGRRIGLIDPEGLEWVAEAAVDVSQFACTTGAILWTTDGHLVRCDLDTERVEIVADGPIAALGAIDDRVYVATNCVHTQVPYEDTIYTPASVTVFEGGVRAGAGILDDATWIRERMRLVPGPRGLYVVERGDDRETLTFLPYAWQPTEGDALLLARWLPDGRGGQLVLAHGSWWSHGTSGELPPEVTAGVNAWLQDNHLNADRVGRTAMPGWQAWVATNVWHAHHGDRVTVNAVALQELVALLAPHIAPLRQWMKLA
ncbi:MAG: hypothetical protein M4D80_24765 [Myxococcota bacterium]|nr:hypothetical protein [Myxococcota bacterium]